MRRVDRHTEWVQRNNYRFHRHPIDRRALRLESLDGAAEGIHVNREFAADQQLGQQRVTVTNDQVLLR